MKSWQRHCAVFFLGVAGAVLLVQSRGPGDEYNAWAKAAHDQLGSLLVTLDVDTR